MVREDISVSAELDQDAAHPGFWRWVYRHYYPRADKIVCVSEFARKDLVENFGIPRAKIVVIYNPVDVERVRRLAEASESPYKGPGPHLVAVGRLWRQKGFDLLLDALAQVRKAIPARLTILGEGPLEADLKAQAQKLGLLDSVRFAGFQTNPYPFFKHADLFVLSSRYEGLPLVVLEALALGKPVVAMDCPGGAREILEGCPGGWLVPELDARHLADTLEAALRPGEGSPPPVEPLETRLNKFSAEHIVQDYQNYFAE
jgi:glycosyltransferase involved in cell wall biosynthesis